MATPHLPDAPELNVTLTDYVARVEIQRPPYNFFDVSLMTQLADTFTALDNHPECRAIVLASKGKAFCAGANFGEQPSAATDQDAETETANRGASEEFSEDGFRNTVGKLYTQGARLFSNKKPIVGAIQGAAVGGGLGLALVPDFRIGTAASRFSANFVKLGLHQGFGISVTLPRLIGEQKAAHMLLTGARINGAEAHALGLLDELVEPEALAERAHAYAVQIAQNAPLAVMSVRATLRQELAAQVTAATEHELKEQQWLRATQDAYEGIRAVAERRPGVFQGR